MHSIFQRQDNTGPIVGCCGWAGSQASYFSQYAAIEIQSTFYHPPAVKIAAQWRSVAPPEFRFCMKAWQLITHTPSSPTYRRLRSPIHPAERDLLGSFRSTEQVWKAWEKTREIADAIRAEVIVFQCPASFPPSPVNVGNFSRFFRRLGAQPYQLAWEPRGPWPPELIHELCAEFGLIHCVDPFASESVHGELLYWRLHGKGGFRYRYTNDDFRELQDQLSRRQNRGAAYIMFNNTAMKTDAERFQTFARSPGKNS